MTRRRALAASTALVAVLGALLAACASGPSQEERVASAIEAYDTVTGYAIEATKLVSETFPDLDLTIGNLDDPRTFTATWRSCVDAPYNDHYDSPDAVRWIHGWVYVLDPRTPTAGLVEPLAQTYVEHGWTITGDYLTHDPAKLVLTKDGYRLSIDGLDQQHLDDVPHVGALLGVSFSSPCLYSPANLTEWDRTDPYDFDLPSGPE